MSRAKLSARLHALEAERTGVLPVADVGPTAGGDRWWELLVGPPDAWDLDRALPAHWHWMTYEELKAIVRMGEPLTDDDRSLLAEIEAAATQRMQLEITSREPRAQAQ